MRWRDWLKANYGWNAKRRDLTCLIAAVGLIVAGIGALILIFEIAWR